MLLLENFHGLTLYPENADRLKELVLQLAVQGKLTEGWRRLNPNLESSAQLLERIKEEKARLIKEGKIKKEKPLEPISEEEVPYELPVGWVWCRLGEIMKSFSGGYSYKSPLFLPEGKNQVLRIGNVKNDNLLLESSPVFIDDKLAEESKYFEILPYDILITMTGTRAKKDYCFSVLVDSENCNEKRLFLNQRVGLFRFLEVTNQAFIIKALKSPLLLQPVFDSATGTANQANIGKEALVNILLPLPSLEEQQAIVARVEELMAQIAELEQQTAERIHLNQQLGAAALQQLTEATGEALEAHWAFLKTHFFTLFDDKENVKKLRESILQLAVQGKLTEAWRRQHPANEPAAVLLQRIQHEKVRLVKEGKIKKEKPLEPISEDKVPYALPEGWVWCRLGSVAESMNNGLYKPANFYSDSGIISLRMYNIQSGNIDFSDARRVNISNEEYNTYSLESGDILINRVNSAELIGKSAIIPEYPERLVYESMNIRMRLVSKIDIAGYVNLILMTLFAREYMRSNAKHAIGQSSINQGVVSNLLIPLPPVDEQKAIVANVEELMALSDELEQQVEKQKAEAERLMEALVHQALCQNIDENAAATMA